MSQQDNQHQSSAHPSVTKITQKWLDNAFTFREITVSGVHYNLAKLNPFKATGHDQISPNALRQAANELSAPLTDIYNRVITEAAWPEAWKLGEWTPVPKKGDPLSRKNYRPVTVLIAVDKIFEQLLCKQLSELDDAVFDNFIFQHTESGIHAKLH